MRSLVVASDFSESARAAALRAARLARELKLERAVLMHVMPAEPVAADLERRAAKAAEALLEALAAECEARGGARLETRLEAGDVVETLAAAAAGFDLVVAGARGHSALKDLVIGTSAERLLRKSPRPVLVVKAPPEGPYRRVVVPVDFSADSAAALGAARRVAPGAELTLVHAVDVPFEGKLQLAGVAQAELQRYRREARDKADREIDAMLEAAGLGKDAAQRVCAREYPPRLIQHTAAATGAELVALGKHGASMLEDLLLGSTTLHALAEVACDVLVVPATARAAPAPG